MARKITKKLVEMMEDGSIDPEVVARAALNYMSEDDVEDLALNEGFIEEESDDDDSGPFERWLGESDADDTDY